MQLEINSLGSDDSRGKYRDALSGYLSRHRDALDQDSQRRLERNPLRILDSKVPQTREIVAGAPTLDNYLTETEHNHFNGLLERLERSNISYVVNPHLVRGLDYYTSTVFEWTTDQLGAQSAVCAGGRYDNLVGSRGGHPSPAIGFALGIERLVELAKLQSVLDSPPQCDIYVIDNSSQPSISMALAESLRDRGIRTVQHCGGGKLKNQLKKVSR